MESPAPDPYLLPGTQVLRNLIEVQDAETLSEIEYTLVSVRLIKLQATDIPVQGTVQQLRQIHQYLFQDVYDWAGELRTINIGKGDSLFLPVQMFETGITYCERVLAEDNMLQGLDHQQFVERLSVNYDNFNVLHPFREGNGRTQRFFWDLIARDAGWHFDWRLTDKQENDHASARALLTADYSDLIHMFDRIVKPLEEPITSDMNDLLHRVEGVSDTETVAKQYTAQEYEHIRRQYKAFGNASETN